MKHLQTAHCAKCKRKIVLVVEGADWEEWIGGMTDRHVQDIFHYLTAAERELLISGYCGDCWSLIFSDEEY